VPEIEVTHKRSPSRKDSYAHHYTSGAGRRHQLALSVRRLEAHESMIGLEELMRSLSGPVSKESSPEFGSRHVQKSAVFPYWLNKYKVVTPETQRLQTQTMTSCTSSHRVLADGQIHSALDIPV